MKTQPVVPADGGTTRPQSLTPADHGLPARWAGRERFVMLATGFGFGGGFLAAWQAWRDDPQRCERLVFIAVEPHPPRVDDLRHAIRDATTAPLVDALVAAWPPLTPNLHTLEFEAGRVKLLLALGDVRALLKELVASVDAFDLEGSAWSTGAFKSIGRLAAPGATVWTASLSHEARDGLAAVGFVLDADARLARHAPRHRTAPPPGGLHRHDGPREAVVVGAGLAGCAAAWALAREGWRVTVVDRADAPACGASGNAIGLVHGVVHGDDGPHARVHRAAALRAASVLTPWIASGRVRGRLDGLLRLDRADAGLHSADHKRDRDRAAAYGNGHAQWLDREPARQRSGLAVATGGWWFPQGGWVVPGDVARAMLEDSGAHFVGGFDATRMERRDGRWRVVGTTAAGETRIDTAVVVLATAEHARDLLDAPLAQALGPLAAVRGQLSALPADAGLAARIAPRSPVSGDGYLAPPLDGLLWFGATSDEADHDASLRVADHRRNLARLAQLVGLPELAALDDESVAAMPGRVAWRAVAPDRLPWVGALPDLAACARALDGRHRIDAPRLVPRLRDAQGGLYAIGAFGSRGIGWAALCGELLASWVSGSPCPLEADLRDALDPARGWLRARRREDQPRDDARMDSRMDS